MAKPLLRVHCITEPGCEYPVAVRIAMDDGTVQTYNLQCRQELLFQKVMDSVEKVIVGYQYTKPAKKRGRLHRHKL